MPSLNLQENAGSFSEIQFPQLGVYGVCSCLLTVNGSQFEQRLNFVVDIPFYRIGYIEILV